MNGVRPEHVGSQDGDRVPARRGYADGGNQRPLPAKIQKKRTSVFILGGPSPTHPAFPWRSHDECSKRLAAPIDTYASCTINRPLTPDSRYGCSQAKQLKPRLRMHDMEPARNPLQKLRRAHRALLHHCIWWHIYNYTDYVLSH